MMRFHTQTAGSSLAAQQIDNNIVRVTLQALSAVLGGTQSLHTNSRDEALSLPTEDSVRTALRTQQIIAHESGVADTVDPFAGSYYMEQLTDAIELAAEELIAKIDDSGGVVSCIENGFIKSQIEQAAYNYQNEIESGERVIVGVNKFQIDGEEKPELLRVDAKVEDAQVAGLQNIRAQRNQSAVDNRLVELKQAAVAGKNLMEPIIGAVREYASLGEICSVLRDVFGEYRD